MSTACTRAVARAGIRQRTAGNIHEQTQSDEVSMTNSDHPTKKEMILEIARDLSVPRFTPAEVEQIRRQMIARLGTAGKKSPDYILGALGSAGGGLVWATKNETPRPNEGKIQKLLHFVALAGAGKWSNSVGEQCCTIKDDV